MESNLDFQIFGKKKFSDLLSEIYNNQKTKEKQISSLIIELQPMVKDIGDATLIVPLIKEYLEIGVKNDEQLIKMATIIQRACSTSTSEKGNSDGLTQAEKTQLLEEIKTLNNKDKE